MQQITHTHEQIVKGEIKRTPNMLDKIYTFSAVRNVQIHLDKLHLKLGRLLIMFMHGRL